MKNLLLTTIVIFTIVACKAQNPIISLYNGTFVPRVDNAYYKDVDNDFNRFIGTWKYTNGTEEFLITLNKKELDYYNLPNDDDKFYTDYMFGEYKYVNTTGQELVNTLSNISNTTIDVSEHVIFGNSIVPPMSYPACNACDSNERRVKLGLKDPGRDYLDYDIVLRTVPNAANPAINDLQLFVIGLNSAIPVGQPEETRIPYGEYLLVKQ